MLIASMKGLCVAATVLPACAPDEYRRKRRSRRRCIMRAKISRMALAAGLPLGLLLPVGETRADPLGELPGRWSGSGSIRMANGATQSVKCGHVLRVGTQPHAKSPLRQPELQDRHESQS